MSLGGKTNVLQTIYASKKLLGKANTSILADPNIETIGSNIQLQSAVIFGQELPQDPSGSYAGLPLTLPGQYSVATNSIAQPVAEYVRLTLTAIAGSTYDADGLSSSQLVSGLDSGGDVLLAGTGTSTAGPHSYQASLPSNYETYSINAKSGTGFFVNSQVLHETSGKIQIVQPNVSALSPNPYTPKLYESDGITEILADDFTDWIVDAYSGIVYVQDYDASTVPAYLDCWIYIGEMTADLNVANAGEGFPFEGDAIITGSLTVSASYVDFTNTTALSASVVSASAYYGFGGYLTGVTADSIDWNNVLSKPILLSGSAQIATEISGAFTATSASIATNITTNTTNITSLTTASASFSTRVTSLETTSNSITNINAVTGSYATTGSNTFTGTNTFLIVSASVVSASTYYGDGSNLTGVTSEWDGSRNGNASITGSLTVSGSFSDIDFNNIGTFVFKNAVGSGSFSGSFAGDGSNLTGVTSATASYVLNAVSSSYATTASYVNSTVFNSTSLPFTGSFTGSFVGDGSGLTGVTVGAGGNTKTFQFNDSGLTSGSTNFEYDKATNTVRATNKFQVTGSTELSGSTTLYGTVTIKAGKSQNAGIYVADNSTGAAASPLSNGNTAIFINTKGATFGALVNNSVVIGGDRTGQTLLRDNTVYLPNVEGTNFSGSFSGSASNLHGYAPNLSASYAVTASVALALAGGLQEVTAQGSSTTYAVDLQGGATASLLQLGNIGNGQVIYSDNANGDLIGNTSFTFNEIADTLKTPNLNVADDSVIGSVATDTMYINASIGSVANDYIQPDADGTLSLGTSTRRWKLSATSVTASVVSASSFVGDGSQITGIVSSSLSNVVFTNLGDSAVQLVDGTLKLSGNIIAENYIISSSVTYMTQSFSSGSTIFGNSLDDTHQFTGSLLVTGSLQLNGYVQSDLYIGAPNEQYDIKYVSGSKSGTISLNHKGNHDDIEIKTANGADYSVIRMASQGSIDISSRYDSSGRIVTLGLEEANGAQGQVRFQLTSGSTATFPAGDHARVAIAVNAYAPTMAANVSHSVFIAGDFSGFTGTANNTLYTENIQSIGTISGSFIGNGSGLTNLPAGAGSYWTSSLDGSISRNSDVDITGSVTATSFEGTNYKIDSYGSGIHISGSSLASIEGTVIRLGHNPTNDVLTSTDIIMGDVGSINGLIQIASSSLNQISLDSNRNIWLGAPQGIVDMRSTLGISGSVFSGSFVGDGSGLTGIVGGLWTGSGAAITRESDVQITGSLHIKSGVISSSQVPVYMNGYTTYKFGDLTSQVDGFYFSVDSLNSVASFGQGSGNGVVTIGTDTGKFAPDSYVLQVAGLVTASAYYGDGSQLTGIASGLWTGSVGYISRQSDVQISGSLYMSASIVMADNINITNGDPTKAIINLGTAANPGDVIIASSGSSFGPTYRGGYVRIKDHQVNINWTNSNVSNFNKIEGSNDLLGIYIGNQSVRFVSSSGETTTFEPGQDIEIDLGSESSRWKTVYGTTFSGSVFSGSFVGDGSGLTNISAGALPSGLLSSSAQIATDISGSWTEMSSSFSTRVTTLETQTVFSGSFSGSFVGDGSGLTNVTAEWDGTHVGNAQITGSLVVSASGTQAMTVYGSGSTVFEVVGTQGTLWSITDSLSGSLFGVGDVSGFQQFEVFSNGDVYTGDEATIQTLHRSGRISSTTANTTQSLVTFNSSSFDGAFIDYTAVSASNARAGSIMAIWNGGTVNYTETTTNDIGSTTGVTMNVGVTGSAIAVQTVTTTAGWNIKATTRAI